MIVAFKDTPRHVTGWWSLSPEKVRVSIGTAGVLGLKDIRLDVLPTTAYLMTYTEESCLANCAFCAQARDCDSEKDHLSRVVWPFFNWNMVLKGFKDPKRDVLERICIQVINYPGFIQDLLEIIEDIKKITNLPVSVDTCPVSKDNMMKMKDAGVERVSIPMDAATEELFNDVKGVNIGGPYRWRRHLEAIRLAVEVFGRGMVGSNLIIGLGETEEEAVSLIQTFHDMGVGTALFAFTPLRGTKLETLSQPPLDAYRRIQAARYLISMGWIRLEDINFKEGRIQSFGVENLRGLLSDGSAFETSGCPGCNRPFYNEKPSGPFYNYPRNLRVEEVSKILDRLLSGNY